VCVWCVVNKTLKFSVAVGELVQNTAQTGLGGAVMVVDSTALLYGPTIQVFALEMERKMCCFGFRETRRRMAAVCSRSAPSRW
jgi:hypothetical protein